MAKIPWWKAKDDLWRELTARGWTMSNPALKVPHATSPDGKYRLWFRPQAIHYTMFPNHKSNLSLSTHTDLRERGARTFADVFFALH